MSFSADVKMEIIENKPLRMRFKKAHAYGLLLYARAYSEQEVCLHTESADIAALYAGFLREYAGRGADVRKREVLRRGKALHIVGLPQARDRQRLLSVFGDGETVREELLPTPEHDHLFLSGAWLSCGNITDPQKSYHMEFVCRTVQLRDILRERLDRYTRRAGETMRRGSWVLYFKECAEIEDLLTMMGASKSSLSMIEVEMIKGVRNKANRVTNCETANIDKTVSASTGQIEDIRLILDRKGIEWLPDNLQEVALLRLANPDSSLRELCQLYPGSISRSGIHHRLDRLSQLAETVRQGAAEIPQPRIQKSHGKGEA